MDGRRRQRWENHRSSYSKKPPRGSWKPTVPAWEKEFCRVVGSLDWETFLQMKKFMHLYTNVIEWNDSAGEEAFSNAKKRFWAKKNGLSCDISLPDPDLYIDKIDWDSETDPELLPDVESNISDAEEDHGAVVIFGDSLMPNQAFAPTGWGDDDENLDVPASHSYANHVDPWGNPLNSWPAAAAAWPGYSNDAWQGYSSDAWQFGNGSGPSYTPWGGHGWNNDCGWNCANNNMNYVKPDMRDDGGQGLWDDSNVTTNNARGYVSNKTPRVQGNEERRNHMSRNADAHRRPPYSRKQSARDRRSNSRESNAIAITAGQRWDQE